MYGLIKLKYFQIYKTLRIKEQSLSTKYSTKTTRSNLLKFSTVKIKKRNMIKRLFSTIRTLPTEQMAKYGVYCPFAFRNLSEAEILEQSVLRTPSCPFTKKTVISHTGALCAWSGEKTGRSPLDKRIVSDEITEKDVDWGKVNMRMTPDKFDELET